MLVHAAVYHMLVTMRMFDYMRMGTAVVSVSHNMGVYWFTIIVSAATNAEPASIITRAVK